MDKPELIDKEDVINYHFLQVSKEESRVTREKLERALRLGNEFKGKTRISFLTDQGPKLIETTVWSVDEQFILIKRGVEIPISSIVDMEWQ